MRFPSRYKIVFRNELITHKNVKRWKLTGEQLVEFGKDIQTLYAIDLILRQHNEKYNTEHRIILYHLTTRHCSPVELIWGKCKLIVRRKNGNTDDGQKNKKYWSEAFTQIEFVKERDGRDYWKMAYESFFKNLAELKRTDSEFYELQLHNDELINNEFVFEEIENNENVNQFDINVANNVTV